MAFDLTGIHNHNEFYTHYYLTTLLEQDVKGVLSGWEMQEKEHSRPAPHREIRALNRRFFTTLDEIEKEKSLAAKLELQNDLLADFFSVLGYEVAPSTVTLDDGICIPVLTQLTKTNGVPQLWVLSVLDRGQESTNPLDCEWQTEVCTPAASGVRASACSVGDFITKRIFTLDEPPRWLIVSTLSQIVLVDRTKWHDKRLLGFDLTEIYARRETTTFQALTALLHKESICPDDGIPLLDSLDENSHKHAYAVSEDLKYSLREAIEKLGNEVLYYFDSHEWKGIKGITAIKNLYDKDIDEFARRLSIECLRYMYRLLFLFYKETGEVISHEDYPQILQQVKMYIADANVYGVDLNPVAVELAEVSLWLNSIYKEGYVPWFGMQLVCGNSLVGARRQVFDAALLKSTKKSQTWLEAVPERVKPGEKRLVNQVYHFLLPDKGMADYNDKVIKQMAGDKITQIKNWRKDFTKAYSKQDIELLKTLSAAIDRLWDAHIVMLKRIRQKTEDTIPVWGQPEYRSASNRSANFSLP